MVLLPQSGGDGSFLALFLAFRARSKEIIPARNALDESVDFRAARIGCRQGVFDEAARPRLLREAVKIVPFDEFDGILQLPLDPRTGEKMRRISLRYALQRGENIAVAVVGERSERPLHDFRRREVPDRGTG